MLKVDSVVVEEPSVNTIKEKVVVQRHRQPTPQEVVSWLPEDATPEQQDSVIQAHIKPSTITWSNRPDTLHLPGHKPGKDIRDVSLPQYYRESFFSENSLFHPELAGGRSGVAGDPIPYTIARDDLMTSLLLACLLLGCVAFIQSRDFIIRQIKYIFYVPSYGTSVVGETATEVRFQLFLCLQTCLLFSILFFSYIHVHYGDTFIFDQYIIISIGTGVFIAYFLLKGLLYQAVNWPFFHKRNNVIWIKSYLFIVSSEGVLLLPVVMLQAYFKLSAESSIIYTVVVIILAKLLSFYKQFVLFFRQKAGFLQIFLYFCALEIVPLCALLRTLAIAADYLKINF